MRKNKREPMQALITVLVMWWALLAVALYANAAEFATLRATAVQLSVGSGAFVEAPSGNKYAITNWHVCEDAVIDGRVILTRPSGESIVSQVTKKSVQLDLCAIAIPKNNPALRVARSFDARPRHTAIYTRGYPERILSESKGFVIGTDKFELRFSTDRGKCPEGMQLVHSFKGNYCLGEYTNHITTLYSQPGSSGSSVINEDGELVGVIQTYKMGEGGGMIPLETVQRFLKDL